MFNRKNLIISADDFGANPMANKRILELASAGKLDRVAIMSEGNFYSGDIAALLTSRVALDIHLDLFGGKEEQSRNVLTRIFKFFIECFSAKGKMKNVEIEWTKQVEKFKTLTGKYPDGINSHQHIHFFPLYFKVALRLAKQFKINYLRFGLSKKSEGINLVCLILKLLSIFNNSLLNSSGLKTSDFLVSLDWVKNTERFLSKLATEETIELVCHPEREDEFNLIKKYF